MPGALVLSAGGMFGAYQAGAWRALSGVWRPDLIVGASAGALNAWAIAGGCSGDELTDFWLAAGSEEVMRLRFPLAPWRGCFEPGPLTRLVARLFARYRPRLPCAITLTRVAGLRPVLVRGQEITPAHLLASCAIPFGFPPVRIGGKIYVDGGLLAALPVWAAVRLGATRLVAVNALPCLPSALLRRGARAVRALAPPDRFPGLARIDIRPAGTLGTVRDALVWKESNIRRWIRLGEEHARAAMQRQTLLDMSTPSAPSS